MDLLFKRYASPFILLDTMIESNSISDFIDTLIDQDNEEKLWQLYLSSLYFNKAQSFEEFKKPKQTEKMTNKEVEATLKDSMEILNSFNPCE